MNHHYNNVKYELPHINGLARTDLSVTIKIILLKMKELKNFLLTTTHPFQPEKQLQHYRPQSDQVT